MRLTIEQKAEMYDEICRILDQWATELVEEEFNLDSGDGDEGDRIEFLKGKGYGWEDIQSYSERFGNSDKFYHWITKLIELSFVPPAKIVLSKWYP